MMKTYKHIQISNATHSNMSFRILFEWRGDSEWNDSGEMIRIAPTYLKSFFVEIQFDGTFTRFVCVQLMLKVISLNHDLSHNRITVMYTILNDDFLCGFLFYHVCAGGSKNTFNAHTDNRFRIVAIGKGENLPNWQNAIFASSPKYRWSTFSWISVTFSRNSSNRKINSIEFWHFQFDTSLRITKYIFRQIEHR